MFLIKSLSEGNTCLMNVLSLADKDRIFQNSNLGRNSTFVMDDIIFVPLLKKSCGLFCSIRKRWKDSKASSFTFVVWHLLRTGVLGSPTFLHNCNDRSFPQHRPDHQQGLQSLLDEFIVPPRSFLQSQE